MKFLEKIKQRMLERKLVNGLVRSYKECCRGLYDDYAKNTSQKFYSPAASFHFPKMDLYAYSNRLREMGYDPKNILLKTAREMDSRGELIVLFYGIMDVDDLDFKPRLKKIPRLDEGMIFLTIQESKE